MRIAAIIVAAGRGTRAGGDLPKQWQLLAGAPVLAHAVAAFRDCERVLVVLHPDDMARGLALFGGSVVLVAGGASRTASVRAALETLAGSGIERVLIHDGARPLIRPAVIAEVVAALDLTPGAAPGVPVTDTLWQVADGRVTGTRDREGLARAQTPQGFRLEAILAAHREGPAEATDDVALLRAAGLDVTVTGGDEENIKITWPGDLARAETILARRAGTAERTRRMDVRLGNGYDVHAFTEGDHVVLCGVKVPHGKALLGHSDADVAMHALTDALYGAMAEGDIGRHFPPSDPQWKGAASEIFLAHAAELARARGFVIGNVDVTIVCERPKVGPHAEAMIAELARILGIEAGRVSVKATTSERLGFTGREEGIAALATATLIAA